MCQATRHHCGHFILFQRVDDMIAFFYYMFHMGSGEKFYEFEHKKSHNSHGIWNHPSLCTTPWPFSAPGVQKLQHLNFFLLKVDWKKCHILRILSFYCFSSYVMYHTLPAANRILQYHSCHSKTCLKVMLQGWLKSLMMKTHEWSYHIHAVLCYSCFSVLKWVHATFLWKPSEICIKMVMGK